MAHSLHLSPLLMATPSSVPTFANQTLPKSMIVETAPIGSLKNCKSLKELEPFHCSMTKLGLLSDVSLMNKFIAKCCEIGTHESMSHARKAFELFKEDYEMDGTLFMYNSLIRGYSSFGMYDESLYLYLRLMCDGISPDKYTFPFVLSACAKIPSYCEGIQIHGLIMKLGLGRDLFVQNSLIHFYLECGEVSYGRKVFDKMPERNVVSWTSLICGYSRKDFVKAAVDLFFGMLQSGVMPNSVTMVCAISACAKLQDLELSKKVCDVIGESGIELNGLMVNALADMYMKCRANDAAKQLFDECKDKSLDLCNTLMSNYVRQGLASEALVILNEILKQGLKSDRVTMLSVISACSQLKNVFWGRCCHGYVLRSGLECWDSISNAMIDMYMKCGKQEAAYRVFEWMPNKTVVSWNSLVTGIIENGEIDKALETFRDMPERDLVSWNTIISAFVQESMFEEAIRLYRDMQNQGIRADRVTMISLASACGYLGTLDLAKWVYYSIQKNEIQLDVKLGTALVDMFARCGDLKSAMEVFNKIVKKDVSAWTAAIGAMAMAGDGEQAIDLFYEMRRQGVKPDGVVFVALLTACSHKGLVEESRKLFKSMKEIHGVAPQIVHYGCMVDSLGRAGLFDEALEVIRSMPMEPNDVVWNSLLAACRVRKNVDLAAYAAERVSELVPEKTGTQVLLSNVYASAGRWSDMAKVRLQLREKGLHKIPGSSLIEINGRIHKFTSGDESHGEMPRISSMLDEMSCRVSEAGHVPDLDNVLLDVDENEKRFLLERHSEKLAMAFALISTNKGSPIRVVKNLRVCADCHSFAKLVSKLYDREIILRDNNRFHFFQNGLCSCSDYW